MTHNNKLFFENSDNILDQFQVPSMLYMRTIILALVRRLVLAGSEVCTYHCMTQNTMILNEEPINFSENEECFFFSQKLVKLNIDIKRKEFSPVACSDSKP